MAESDIPKIYACCLDERTRKVQRVLPILAKVATAGALFIGIPVAICIGNFQSWVVPVALLGGALLFTALYREAPGRYELHHGELIVRRLGGAIAVSLPYAKVTEVEFRRPSPLVGASNVEGRKNLAGNMGYCYNRELGEFEAWTTTMEHAVLIGRPKLGPLVLSPETPEDFVAELRRRVATATAARAQGIEPSAANPTRRELSI